MCSSDLASAAVATIGEGSIASAIAIAGEGAPSLFASAAVPGRPPSMELGLGFLDVPRVRVLGWKYC